MITYTTEQKNLHYKIEDAIKNNVPFRISGEWYESPNGDMSYQDCILVKGSMIYMEGYLYSTSSCFRDEPSCDEVNANFFRFAFALASNTKVKFYKEKK